MNELPPFLQPTPEQVEADRKRQAIARAHHLRVRQSPAELKLGRAVMNEPAIRANLAHLHRGSAYQETKAQLAENLAEQGRYEEAIKYANKDQKKEYKTILAALDRDDSETCNCPPKIHKNGTQRIEVSQSFVEQEVFSQKHGKMVSLVKCNCGFANAK